MKAERVLFGLLALINTALLGALILLAFRHDLLLAAMAPLAVFVAWVVILFGPWRPVEGEDLRSPNVGEVSLEGVRGFGLAPGVVWRWEDVDRVILTHIWMDRSRTRDKRRIPTWALVQQAGEQVWVPRAAFAERGWLLPQDFLLDRCGAEKVYRDDRLLPPDPPEVRTHPTLLALAILPMGALLGEAMHWPRLGSLVLVLPLVLGLAADVARCRWTVLALLAQSLAAMWVVSGASASAAESIRQGWFVEVVVLSIGLVMLVRETRRPA